MGPKHRQCYADACIEDIEARGHLSFWIGFLDARNTGSEGLDIAQPEHDGGKNRISWYRQASCKVGFSLDARGKGAGRCDHDALGVHGNRDGSWHIPCAMCDRVGEGLPEGIQWQLLDPFSCCRSHFLEGIGPLGNVYGPVELLEYRTAVYTHSFENLGRAFAEPHDVDSGEGIRIGQEGSSIYELAICIHETECSQGVTVELIDSELCMQALP